MIDQLKRLYKGSFEVSDHAPSTFRDLNSCSKGIVKVWAGASDRTIWIDPKANYLFRAWHDSLHLKHQLDFTPRSEYLIADISTELASRVVGDSFADIVNAEVRGQVEYFNKFNEFPTDQVKFINYYLKYNKLPEYTL